MGLDLLTIPISREKAFDLLENDAELRTMVQSDAKTTHLSPGYIPSFKYFWHFVWASVEIFRNS